MEILCCNPVIIVNKSYKVNQIHRSHDWKIIIRNHEYVSVPSPRKANIQKSDLDDCYYLNVKTGEMIPIYNLVPCQKCIICRDKKAVDWATRIVCESNYHINCPWWITLTYNHYNIHPDGLNKRDLQLFLKRLRERLSRRFPDVRLRYVAVGEYGGNTARPHYHMQLFGMPLELKDARDVLSIIEESWSHRISLKRFKEILFESGDDGSHYTFVRDNCNGKPMYYLRNGFAYVKPAHDNTPLYLAKYMFKPEINTPKGCVDNFYLSSRKNGIGFQYAYDNIDYYSNNPNVTCIELVNRHTGKYSRFGIPQYFKDMWYPTPSKIFKQEVKQSFNEFQILLNEYYTIQMETVKIRDINIQDDVTQMISVLNNKYSFWYPLHVPINPVFDVRFEFEQNHLIKTLTGRMTKIEVFGLFKPIPEYNWHFDKDYPTYLREQIMCRYRKLYELYDKLMSVAFDTENILYNLTFRDKHKAYITQFMLTKPQMSVVDKVYQLKERYNKLKSRDIY